MDGIQPQRRDPQARDVVEPRDQPLEVAPAVTVRVEERFDVDAVDHRVLEPLLHPPTRFLARLAPESPQEQVQDNGQEHRYPDGDDDHRETPGEAAYGPYFEVSTDLHGDVVPGTSP